MDKWFTECWTGRGLLLTVLLIACLHGQSKTSNGNESDVRFVALDIVIDSGEDELAAYQFELKANSKQVQIVGLEGGEHAAFREPPFYDPAGLSQNRIIVAAFSTAKALPNGKLRIARINLQIDENVEPEYAIKLITAASSDGKNISPKITAVAAKTRAAKGATQ